jgi:hypothetical protein
MRPGPDAQGRTSGEHHSGGVNGNSQPEGTVAPPRASRVAVMRSSAARCIRLVSIRVYEDPRATGQPPSSASPVGARGERHVRIMCRSRHERAGCRAKGRCGGGDRCPQDPILRQPNNTLGVPGHQAIKNRGPLPLKITATACSCTRDKSDPAYPVRSIRPASQSPEWRPDSFAEKDTRGPRERRPRAPWRARSLRLVRGLLGVNRICRKAIITGHSVRPSGEDEVMSTRANRKPGRGEAGPRARPRTAAVVHKPAGNAGA